MKRRAKDILADKLRQEHCFWSFDPNSIKDVPDDILIEKTLRHLDLTVSSHGIILRRRILMPTSSRWQHDNLINFTHKRSSTSYRQNY